MRNEVRVSLASADVLVEVEYKCRSAAKVDINDDALGRVRARGRRRRGHASREIKTGRSDRTGSDGSPLKLKWQQVKF